MKIENNTIAAAALLLVGLAWSIGPANAQAISPGGVTADGPMSIMVPFVVAAVKDRPAKHPYALIVAAPLARVVPERPLPAPIFLER